MAFRLAKEKNKLEELAKSLEAESSIPKINFGNDGIGQKIKTVFGKRRRAQKREKVDYDLVSLCKLKSACVLIKLLSNILKVPMNRKLLLFSFKGYLKKCRFPKFENSRLKNDDSTTLQSRAILPEIFPNSPNRDVTLLPQVCLRCQSALLGSERAWKEACLAIQK